MSTGQEILRRPLRPRVVCRYLGMLGLPLGGLLAVPIVPSVWSGETALAVRLGLVCLVVLAASLAASRVRAPKNVQENEVLASAALIFLILSVAMAAPLSTAGLSAMDAVFESVSAITTTGLSMVTDSEGAGSAFLFTRSWMQWLGGLVILVLALAFVLEPGAAARKLGALASDSGNARESTFLRGRRILVAYALLTSVGFLGIWALEGDAVSALIHALSAVSTGGFSTHTDSLAGLASPAARWAVTALSFAGAVPMLLFFAIFMKGVASSGAASEAKALALVSVVLIGALAVAFMASGAAGWTEALTDAALLGVSAQSTTGYSAMDVAGLSPTAKALLVAAMMVGGSSGSTAGGLKVFRVLIVVLLVRLVLLKVSAAPHAKPILRMGGRRMSPAMVQRALAVILIYLAICYASWLAFLAAGHPPLDSLFEVVSALSTVGLSTGIAGPDLQTALKLVLCAGMLLGRLEILAFLVLLYPRNWSISGKETT